MKINKRRLLGLLLLALLVGVFLLRSAPTQSPASDLPLLPESTEAPGAELILLPPSSEESPAAPVVSDTAPLESMSPELPAEAAATPQPTVSSVTPPVPSPTPEPRVREDGEYDKKDDVALYIHLYGHLPSNYITKKDAEALGWTGGSLEPYAPGKSIGGGRFGNYEGLLPSAKGRSYSECDIGTRGAKSRGAKRIVYSNDGLIYYSRDHYESFELLYGEP